MNKNPDVNNKIEEEAIKIIKRNEFRRRIFSYICGGVGIISLLYAFHYYSGQDDLSDQNSGLSDRKDIVSEDNDGYELVMNPELLIEQEDGSTKEMIPEYLDLYKLNKNLIGWIKIADTIVDYPVLQTIDNEFYLTHDFKQDYNRGGSIFLDKRCDFSKPSTNLILYGHNLKSEKMFGTLKYYKSEDYYKEHSVIGFDTLYEKGQYQIVFVFESDIYQEKDVVFKYYDFIDANSEHEFNSNIQEMDKISIYDTGYDVEYGDELLTLSTCDNNESTKRFVIVAKKIN